MKKILALLLACVMIFGLVACGAKEEAPAEEPKEEAKEEAKEEPKEEAKEEAAPEEPKETIEITYACTIGAYLAKLQEKVDEYNAGVGAEKGIFIRLDSYINEGSAGYEPLLAAGQYYDIIDGGGSQAWCENGWIADLEEIAKDYPDLQTLIDAYKPYAREGVGLVEGVMTNFPLEVLPIKMAVNLDLLEKYDCEIPTTWDELLAVAEKISTESGGTDYGYGLTNWSALYRRLTFKATAASNEKYWWDPNTETYSFAQYKEPMEAMKKMADEGWAIGLDDLAIDPIRAQFAEGNVAMFPAPSYDFAVYTTQFPCEFNFTFVDMPVYGDDAGKYYGACIERGNNSICLPAFEAADQAKKDAIVEAFCFLNSDEMNKAIYAIGGIIPIRAELMDGVELEIDEKLQPIWLALSDTNGYGSYPEYPDGVIVDNLEEGKWGQKYDAVFSAFMHGECTFDEAAADCEERYNAAYKATKEEGVVDVSRYTAAYEHKAK